MVVAATQNVDSPKNDFGISLLDRYLLRLMVKPMLGALGVTLVALLLERILRLLDVLSQSSNRFGFVAELAVNLVPHYLGLTLPAAFFIALFMVISRLNEGSEIDALLASGVSLSRVVVPLVCLGTALMIVSLTIYGFAQPYGRYGYRAVLHAAENAGWNGLVQSQAFVSPDDSVTLTADEADTAGRTLQRVFVRRVSADGREDITTAQTGKIMPDADGKSVTLELIKGQQLSSNHNEEPRILVFNNLTVRVPLAGAAKLLRARGGDEQELTFFELIGEASQAHPMLPRQTLLAELFARLARCIVVPMLPLLALPLGLAAKRGGRAPGIIVAGVVLLAFQHLLRMGQGLAADGQVSAVVGVGGPFLLFTVLCVSIFVSSRKRPGETPIGLLSERIAQLLRHLLPPKRRLKQAKAAAS